MQQTPQSSWKRFYLRWMSGCIGLGWCALFAKVFSGPIPTKPFSFRLWGETCEHFYLYEDRLGSTPNSILAQNVVWHVTPDALKCALNLGLTNTDGQKSQGFVEMAGYVQSHAFECSGQVARGVGFRHFNWQVASTYWMHKDAALQIQGDETTVQLIYRQRILSQWVLQARVCRCTQKGYQAQLSLQRRARSCSLRQQEHHGQLWATPKLYHHKGQRSAQPRYPRNRPGKRKDRDQPQPAEPKRMAASESDDTSERSGSDDTCETEAVAAIANQRFPHIKVSEPTGPRRHWADISRTQSQRILSTFWPECGLSAVPSGDFAQTACLILDNRSSQGPQSYAAQIGRIFKPSMTDPVSSVYLHFSACDQEKKRFSGQIKVLGPPVDLVILYPGPCWVDGLRLENVRRFTVIAGQGSFQSSTLSIDKTWPMSIGNHGLSASCVDEGDINAGNLSDYAFELAQINVAGSVVRCRSLLAAESIRCMAIQGAGTLSIPTDSSLPMQYTTPRWWRWFKRTEGTGPSILLEAGSQVLAHHLHLDGSQQAIRQRSGAIFLCQNAHFCANHAIFEGETTVTQSLALQVESWTVGAPGVAGQFEVLGENATGSTLQAASCRIEEQAIVTLTEAALRQCQQLTLLGRLQVIRSLTGDIRDIQVKSGGRWVAKEGSTLSLHVAKLQCQPESELVFGNVTILMLKASIGQRVLGLIGMGKAPDMHLIFGGRLTILGSANIQHQHLSLLSGAQWSMRNGSLALALSECVTASDSQLNWCQLDSLQFTVTTPQGCCRIRWEGKVSLPQKMVINGKLYWENLPQLSVPHFVMEATGQLSFPNEQEEFILNSKQVDIAAPEAFEGLNQLWVSGYREGESGTLHLRGKIAAKQTHLSGSVVLAGWQAAFEKLRLAPTAQLHFLKNRFALQALQMTVESETKIDHTGDWILEKVGARLPYLPENTLMIAALIVFKGHRHQLDLAQWLLRHGSVLEVEQTLHCRCHRLQMEETARWTAQRLEWEAWQDDLKLEIFGNLQTEQLQFSGKVQVALGCKLPAGQVTLTENTTLGLPPPPFSFVTNHLKMDASARVQPADHTQGLVHIHRLSGESPVQLDAAEGLSLTSVVLQDPVALSGQSFCAQRLLLKPSATLTRQAAQAMSPRFWLLVDQIQVEGEGHLDKRYSWWIGQAAGKHFSENVEEGLQDFWLLDGAKLTFQQSATLDWHGIRLAPGSCLQSAQLTFCFRHGLSSKGELRCHTLRLNGLAEPGQYGLASGDFESVTLELEGRVNVAKANFSGISTMTVCPLADILGAALPATCLQSFCISSGAVLALQALDQCVRLSSDMIALIGELRVDAGSVDLVANDTLLVEGAEAMRAKIDVGQARLGLEARILRLRHATVSAGQIGLKANQEMLLRSTRLVHTVASQDCLLDGGVLSLEQVVVENIPMLYRKTLQMDRLLGDSESLSHLCLRPPMRSQEELVAFIRQPITPTSIRIGMIDLDIPWALRVEDLSNLSERTNTLKLRLQKGIDLTGLQPSSDPVMAFPKLELPCDLYLNFQDQNYNHFLSLSAYTIQLEGFKHLSLQPKSHLVATTSCVRSRYEIALSGQSFRSEPGSTILVKGSGGLNIDTIEAQTHGGNYVSDGDLSSSVLCDPEHPVVILESASLCSANGSVSLKFPKDMNLYVCGVVRSGNKDISLMGAKQLIVRSTGSMVAGRNLDIREVNRLQNEGWLEGVHSVRCAVTESIENICAGKIFSSGMILLKADALLLNSAGGFFDATSRLITENSDQKVSLILSRGGFGSGIAQGGIFLFVDKLNLFNDAFILNYAAELSLRFGATEQATERARRISATVLVCPSTLYSPDRNLGMEQMLEATLDNPLLLRTFLSNARELLQSTELTNTGGMISAGQGGLILLTGTLSNLDPGFSTKEVKEMIPQPTKFVYQDAQNQYHTVQAIPALQAGQVQPKGTGYIRDRQDATVVDVDFCRVGQDAKIQELVVCSPEGQIEIYSAFSGEIGQIQVGNMILEESQAGQLTGATGVWIRVGSKVTNEGNIEALQSGGELKVWGVDGQELKIEQRYLNVAKSIWQRKKMQREFYQADWVGNRQIDLAKQGFQQVLAPHDKGLIHRAVQLTVFSPVVALIGGIGIAVTPFTGSQWIAHKKSEEKWTPKTAHPGLAFSEAEQRAAIEAARHRKAQVLATYANLKSDPHEWLGEATLDDPFQSPHDCAAGCAQAPPCLASRWQTYQKRWLVLTNNLTKALAFYTQQEDQMMAAVEGLIPKLTPNGFFATLMTEGTASPSCTNEALKGLLQCFLWFSEGNCFERLLSRAEMDCVAEGLLGCPKAFFQSRPLGDASEVSEEAFRWAWRLESQYFHDAFRETLRDLAQHRALGSPVVMLPKQPVRLPNLGKSSYFNAALQMLFNHPDFRRIALRQEHTLHCLASDDQLPCWRCLLCATLQHGIQHDRPQDKSIAEPMACRAGLLSHCLMELQNTVRSVDRHFNRNRLDPKKPADANDVFELMMQHLPESRPLKALPAAFVQPLADWVVGLTLKCVLLEICNRCQHQNIAPHPPIYQNQWSLNCPQTGDKPVAVLLRESAQAVLDRLRPFSAQTCPGCHAPFLAEYQEVTHTEDLPKSLILKLNRLSPQMQQGDRSLYPLQDLPPVINLAKIICVNRSSVQGRLQRIDWEYQLNRAILYQPDKAYHYAMFRKPDGDGSIWIRCEDDKLTQDVPESEVLRELQAGAVHLQYDVTLRAKGPIRCEPVLPQNAEERRVPREKAMAVRATQAVVAACEQAWIRHRHHTRIVVRSRKAKILEKLSIRPDVLWTEIFSPDLIRSLQSACAPFLSESEALGQSLLRQGAAHSRQQTASQNRLSDLFQRSAQRQHQDLIAQFEYDQPTARMRGTHMQIAAQQARLDNQGGLVFADQLAIEFGKGSTVNNSGWMHGVEQIKMTADVYNRSQGRLSTGKGSAIGETGRIAITGSFYTTDASTAETAVFRTKGRNLVVNGGRNLKVSRSAYVNVNTVDLSIPTDWNERPSGGDPAEPAAFTENALEPQEALARFQNPYKGYQFGLGSLSNLLRKGEVSVNCALNKMENLSLQNTMTLPLPGLIIADSDAVVTICAKKSFRQGSGSIVFQKRRMRRKRHRRLFRNDQSGQSEKEEVYCPIQHSHADHLAFPKTVERTLSIDQAKNTLAAQGESQIPWLAESETQGEAADAVDVDGLLAGEGKTTYREQNITFQPTQVCAHSLSVRVRRSIAKLLGSKLANRTRLPSRLRRAKKSSVQSTLPSQPNHRHRRTYGLAFFRKRLGRLATIMHRKARPGTFQLFTERYEAWPEFGMQKFDQKSTCDWGKLDLAVGHFFQRAIDAASSLVASVKTINSWQEAAEWLLCGGVQAAAFLTVATSLSLHPEALFHLISFDAQLGYTQEHLTTIIQAKKRFMESFPSIEGPKVFRAVCHRLKWCGLKAECDYLSLKSMHASFQAVPLMDTKNTLNRSQFSSARTTIQFYNGAIPIPTFLELVGECAQPLLGKERLKPIGSASSHPQRSQGTKQTGRYPPDASRTLSGLPGSCEIVGSQLLGEKTLRVIIDWCLSVVSKQDIQQCEHTQLRNDSAVRLGIHMRQPTDWKAFIRHAWFEITTPDLGCQMRYECRSSAALAGLFGEGQVDVLIRGVSHWQGGALLTARPETLPSGSVKVVLRKAPCFRPLINASQIEFLPLLATLEDTSVLRNFCVPPGALHALWSSGEAVGNIRNPSERGKYNWSVINHFMQYLFKPGNVEKLAQVLRRSSVWRSSKKADAETKLANTMQEAFEKSIAVFKEDRLSFACTHTSSIISGYQKWNRDEIYGRNDVFMGCTAQPIGLVPVRTEKELGIGGQCLSARAKKQHMRLHNLHLAASLLGETAQIVNNVYELQKSQKIHASQRLATMNPRPSHVQTNFPAHPDPGPFAAAQSGCSDPYEARPSTRAESHFLSVYEKAYWEVNIGHFSFRVTPFDVCDLSLSGLIQYHSSGPYHGRALAKRFACVMAAHALSRSSRAEQGVQAAQRWLGGKVGLDLTDPELQNHYFDYENTLRSVVRLALGSDYTYLPAENARARKRPFYTIEESCSLLQLSDKRLMDAFSKVTLAHKKAQYILKKPEAEQGNCRRKLEKGLQNPADEPDVAQLLPEDSPVRLQWDHEVAQLTLKLLDDATAKEAYLMTEIATAFDAVKKVYPDHSRKAFESNCYARFVPTTQWEKCLEAMAQSSVDLDQNQENLAKNLVEHLASGSCEIVQGVDPSTAKQNLAERTKRYLQFLKNSGLFTTLEAQLIFTPGLDEKINRALEQRFQPLALDGSARAAPDGPGKPVLTCEQILAASPLRVDPERLGDLGQLSIERLVGGVEDFDKLERSKRWLSILAREVNVCPPETRVYFRSEAVTRDPKTQKTQGLRMVCWTNWSGLENHLKKLGWTGIVHLVPRESLPEPSRINSDYHWNSQIETQYQLHQAFQSSHAVATTSIDSHLVGCPQNRLANIIGTYRTPVGSLESSYCAPTPPSEEKQRAIELLKIAIPVIAKQGDGLGDWMGHESGDSLFYNFRFQAVDPEAAQGVKKAYAHLRGLECQDAVDRRCAVPGWRAPPVKDMLKNLEKWSSNSPEMQNIEQWAKTMEEFDFEATKFAIYAHQRQGIEFSASTWKKMRVCLEKCVGPNATKQLALFQDVAKRLEQPDSLSYFDQTDTFGMEWNEKGELVQMAVPMGLPEVLVKHGIASELTRTAGKEADWTWSRGETLPVIEIHRTRGFISEVLINPNGAAQVLDSGLENVRMDCQYQQALAKANGDAAGETHWAERLAYLNARRKAHLDKTAPSFASVCWEQTRESLLNYQAWVGWTCTEALYETGSKVALRVASQVASQVAARVASYAFPATHLITAGRAIQWYRRIYRCYKIYHSISDNVRVFYEWWRLSSDSHSDPDACMAAWQALQRRGAAIGYHVSSTLAARRLQPSVDRAILWGAGKVFDSMGIAWKPELPKGKGIFPKMRVERRDLGLMGYKLISQRAIHTFSRHHRKGELKKSYRHKKTEIFRVRLTPHYTEHVEQEVVLLGAKCWKKRTKESIPRPFGKSRDVNYKAGAVIPEDVMLSQAAAELFPGKRLGATGHFRPSQSNANPRQGNVQQHTLESILETVEPIVKPLLAKPPKRLAAAQLKTYRMEQPCPKPYLPAVESLVLDENAPPAMASFAEFARIPTRQIPAVRRPFDPPAIEEDTLSRNTALTPLRSKQMPAYPVTDPLSDNHQEKAVVIGSSEEDRMMTDSCDWLLEPIRLDPAQAKCYLNSVLQGFIHDPNLLPCLMADRRADRPMSPIEQLIFDLPRRTCQSRILPFQYWLPLYGPLLPTAWLTDRDENGDLKHQDAQDCWHRLVQGSPSMEAYFSTRFRSGCACQDRPAQKLLSVLWDARADGEGMGDASLGIGVRLFQAGALEQGRCVRCHSGYQQVDIDFARALCVEVQPPGRDQDIPLELTLTSPWLRGRRRKHANYRLQSAVIYRGDGVRGHYRACVRKQDTWYLCDDQKAWQGPERISRLLFLQALLRDEVVQLTYERLTCWYSR